MFVSATMLFGAGRSVQVRLRNMSPNGALIESATLPPPGSAIELTRGSLRAAGRIIWSREGQCGVALDGSVDVPSWMARQPPAHQQRVDAMVAEARATIGQGAAPVPADPASGVGAVGDELRDVIAIIAALELSLADDPYVIERHGEVLQGIDRALQRLRLLAQRNR